MQISNNKITEIFRTVSSVKTGNYLLNSIRLKLNDDEDIYYSVCVFKYTTKPTFIEEELANWEEEKIAYLLIVEIEDYIVISKKNISKLQDFIKQFKPLDYSVLSTLFVTDDTSFEKFSLKNLNVSDKAVREKTIEAIDLKENFSALGASNYLLNSLRLKNNEEKTSLMLNSSRINKFGKKNSIENFCFWSKNLVHQIKNHINTNTFLSIFAEPQDYEVLKDTLVPISILFNFSNIYTDFEQGLINRVIIRYINDDGENQDKDFNLIDFLAKFERLCKVFTNGGIHSIENSTSKDLEIKLNDKSITVRSQKLKNVKLIHDNGNEISITDYINGKNSFIINFDNIDLAYTNRKLFKDSRLIGSIPNFLKIFQPHNDLDNVTSEKGAFLATSTLFETNSIFRFVEDNFQNDFDYFICDDLSKEWADHIGISENKISFFHSKHKSSNASASAFQDIVGQAQKNLGNLTPQDFQLESKRNIWNSNYNSSDGVNTQITRSRKGQNANQIINQFKETINNPYLRKHVVLVIDFISKSDLETYLENLTNGVYFAERNETIQILWFVSSLISSCQELNTEVTIYCKP
ncbi:hypothetical protein [Sphingobacterium bovistauri]|uniref:Sporadically distributed protein, TIGR04141 family n=1 Tax=Sphingobacterium bovistauri TaxID=2781959 RepID=A0ABS7Z9X2_9SPHI|nr:hypothetical protein [Sphingobacterium bovistauri]MCA5006372.1 hypothetical protein [Sphingobacterium bovistauri]